MTRQQLYASFNAIGNLAEAVGSIHMTVEHVGIAYTDTAILLKQGFRGFTMDALPRDETGAVYWHQMADTVDKIEPDCLRRVHEFAWEMLQRLDQAV